MDELRQALGSVVRQTRVERGWTQDDLADATGLQPTYISDLERGRRTPGVHTLERIAEAFQVKVWQMMKSAEESVHQADPPEPN